MTPAHELWLVPCASRRTGVKPNKQQLSLSQSSILAGCCSSFDNAGCPADCAVFSFNQFNQIAKSSATCRP